MAATAEEVSVNYDFKGKVALVTGATNGYGLESARVLALRNCKVLLGARTMEKGIEAKKQILASIGEDKADLIEPVELDLTTLNNVREFVKAFGQRSDKRLHILMNNAGATTSQVSKTPDGFEYHIGINHLAPFLLTLLLLPYLKVTALESKIASRIIVVGSNSIIRLPPYTDIEDYNSERPDLSQMYKYPFSKLYNYLCSTHLHRLLQQTFPNGEIVCNSCNPGLALSGLAGRDRGAEGSRKWMDELTKNSPHLKEITIPEGAATQVFLAGDETAGKSGGHYYDKCTIGKATALAEDPKAQKRAWEITEKVLGLTYEQAVNVTV